MLPRIVCIFLVVWLGIIRAYGEEEIESILEMFYEETGRVVEVDVVRRFSIEPIEMKMKNSGLIAKLLGVDKRIGRDIVRMWQSGMSIKDICDSLRMLPSERLLLEKCTKVAKSVKSRKTNELSVAVRSRWYSDFSEDSTRIGGASGMLQRVEAGWQGFKCGYAMGNGIGETLLLDKRFYFSYEGERIEAVLGNFFYKSFWGNVLGEPMGVRKGSNPVRVGYLNGSEIEGTTSMLPYGLFNGLGVRGNVDFWGGWKLRLGGFFSRTKRNASLDTTTGTITSIDISGVFVDSNDLRKRGILSEDAGSLELSAESERMKLGYLMMYLRYGNELATVSKKFVRGKEGSFHSVFFESKFGGVDVSGEMSIDGMKEIGVFGGIRYKGKGYGFVVDLRYFSVGFRSPFGAALGERAYPNNEFGLYCGVELSWDGLEAEMYGDLFRGLESGRLLQGLERGGDVFVQLFMRGKSRWTRFKFRRKEEMDYVYNPQKTNQILYSRVKTQLLFENRIILFQNLSSKQRFDYIYINNSSLIPNENGLHFSLEFENKFTENFKLGLRGHYYSTTSYSSAIYFFEIFAPEYMYSIPLYGTGFRTSIWTNLKVLNGLNLFLKYIYDTKKLSKNYLVGQIDLNYSF